MPGCMYAYLHPVIIVCLAILNVVGRNLFCFIFIFFKVLYFWCNFYFWFICLFVFCQFVIKLFFCPCVLWVFLYVWVFLSIFSYIYFVICSCPTMFSLFYLFAKILTGLCIVFLFYINVVWFLINLACRPYLVIWP